MYFIRTYTFILLSFAFTVTVCGQDSLFPNIPGWDIALDDQVYDANNLWDIIDGAADLYLEYAFINLHIARYINTDGIEIKVEIYSHNSEEDAFGIYSQERNPDYNFIKMGTQGYLQQGILNFLTGHYYIKLSICQSGDKAKEALQTIARYMNKHLNQNNALPRILQYFPEKGKRANAEQYVARNFLGYSFLNCAYLASYYDSSAFKVFILEAKSEDSAKKVLNEYLNKIPKENVKMFTADKYEILDAHNGIIELQIVKQYVIGILNCTDTEERNAYLKQVAESLSK